ncbi:MAG: lysophospholipid acyltransferase family protein [Gammaproteobacteria bacterium]|nr:lysophospholipid acyltransferase family protein [Gammaproteobacteria bacterium]
METQELSQRMVAGVLRILALFPLSVLRKFGRIYGWAMSLSSVRVARTTRTNLALCYPSLSPKQLRVLAKRSLCETGCTLFEMAAIWNWNAAALQNLIVRFDGRDLLEQELKRGGVICVCPHWGNWEVAAFAFGLNYEATSLYDARRLAGHVDRVTRLRSRFGLSMASIMPSGLRTVLRALRSSEVVLVLPDQVPTRGKNVVAKFMGIDAVTTTIVQSLSQHTGASITLLTFQRVPKGFHIRVEPISRSVDDDDPTTSAQAINDEIERVIQRDPAQYQWEYKRFRRIPDRDYYS